MRILNETSLRNVILPRCRQTHKSSFGKVCLVGGNTQYGGAIILASSAAVYSGAGLVTTVCAEKNHAPLHARLPEAMVLDFSEEEKWKQTIDTSTVIAIGCGLGESAESLSLFREILRLQQKNQWLIIDGSAISLFAKEKLSLNFPEKVVFTPHEKELERLSKLSIPNQSPENIQAFVQELGAIVVAKSHETKIFSPNHEMVQIGVGTPAMATGGMGDTLVGILAGFLAQFRKDPYESLLAGSFIHSFIAETLACEHYVVLPSKLIDTLPKVMKSYEKDFY